MSRPLSKAEIERKVEEVLQRDERKLVKALDLYYQNFTGEGGGMTFNGAAHRARVNPAYLVSYMFYRKKYGLGMPDDREDAAAYFQNLQRLKNDLHLR